MDSCAERSNVHSAGRPKCNELAHKALSTAAAASTSCTPAAVGIVGDVRAVPAVLARAGGAAVAAAAGGGSTGGVVAERGTTATCVCTEGQSCVAKCRLTRVVRSQRSLCLRLRRVSKDEVSKLHTTVQGARNGPRCTQRSQVHKMVQGTRYVRTAMLVAHQVLLLVDTVVDVVSTVLALPADGAVACVHLIGNVGAHGIVLCARGSNACSCLCKYD